MDELVASAIAHWGPRFTANGVFAADFAEVTGRVEAWSDWCAAWSAVAAGYERLGRAALASGRSRTGGEHLARASVYYHFGKFVFVEHPDQMRAAHERSVRCLADAQPHLDHPGLRVEIPFEQAKIVGILRCPDGGAPHPTVVLLPGLDSTKEELRATEDTLLARGLATFSVDGPGQGEAEYDLPIRGDWTAVAEVVHATLRTRQEVAGDRIGVWGVSLGGYYAPRVAAALGERVRACVALSGPYDFGASWDRLPALTRHTFAVRAGANGEAQARRIAATLTLEGHASAITAPLLVVFGRQDRLFPFADAERLREAAGGPAELVMFETGNHGCANLAPRHRPHTADWLAERLA